MIFGLLAALAYGSSDFTAGLGVQLLALAAAAVGLLIFPVQAVSAAAMGWGLMAEIGGVVGTLCLYRGLAVGQMSVVAPVSGVVSASLPVVVGLVDGERISVLVTCGLMLAVPAIALVCLQDAPQQAGLRARRGLAEGAASGLGFGLLFIGIDRAGSHMSTWPLMAGLLLASLLIAPLLWRAPRVPANADAARRGWQSIVIAGALAGAANLLFLAGTRRAGRTMESQTAVWVAGSRGGCRTDFAGLTLCAVAPSFAASSPCIGKTCRRRLRRKTRFTTALNFIPTCR